MIFACTQENLLQGLSLVSHITGKNVNLPILGNVLLKTEGGNLKLSTTNLEMAVSALVRGRVEEEGEYTVPAKLLLDYVHLLPDGKVELVVKNDVLEVRADGNVTSIKGMVASEFPLIPKLAKRGGYKIEADALRQAIGQVVFSVSTSEARPELSGVACYFNQENQAKTLIMAATDSYRLAERRLSLLPGTNEAEAKCIVPARAMLEISRILSGYKDDVTTPTEVEWAITESQLVFTFGNVEMVSRLIEGSFPDYRQIIPTQFRSVLQVSRAELAKAIRAAALFARQGLYDVHFEMTDSGEMKVSSADNGTGSHTTTLKIPEGQEANRVTINFKYMTDGLTVIPTDRVTLSLIDAMNPVVVRPLEDETFQYVVMPIRQ